MIYEPYTNKQKLWFQTVRHELGKPDIKQVCALQTNFYFAFSLWWNLTDAAFCSTFEPFQAFSPNKFNPFRLIDFIISNAILGLMFL